MPNQGNDQGKNQAVKPFTIFDGDALFLVPVPFVGALEANGFVFSEYATKIVFGYLNLLIDRELRENIVGCKPARRGDDR